MAAANKIIRLKKAAQKRSQNRDEAKIELARHAIAALAQLGYARTSMRDIAAQSGRSIGALNYYFEDKTALITFCVQLYKADFVKQIDEIISGANSKGGLRDAIIEGFVQTVEDDAVTHRLWYDIRSQSLFDEDFHVVANEIEQALIDMIGRLMARLPNAAQSPNAESKTLQAYYLLDGSFRTNLQRQLQGEANTAQRFRKELQAMFECLAE